MADVHNKQDTAFFGQPFALANLFGVEMWERFSFYGMQGILIYYLYYSVSDGGLGLAESSATSIVGAYGGTVYLSTILGGWVADRLLGSERTLFYSAVFHNRDPVRQSQRFVKIMCDKDDGFPQQSLQP